MAILRGGTKVQGDETVNGDSIVTRNETVDGNLLVKGSVTALQGVNNLALASWEQISELPYLEYVFKVGDEKTIKIGSANYTVQILDFYHDDMVEGGKARITFGLKGLYPPTKAHKNSSTNAGGWENSDIRSYLKNDVYNKLPSDLRSVIKEVNKPTADGGNQSGTKVVKSKDKLFLFSEMEVFGTSQYSHAGEGSKYPIFTDNPSRIKGDAFWWLRSPISIYDDAFCSVNDDGGLYITTYALYTYGVCFGFCV